jgi:hypothetical protein
MAGGLGDVKEIDGRISGASEFTIEIEIVAFGDTRDSRT